MVALCVADLYLIFLRNVIRFPEQNRTNETLITNQQWKLICGLTYTQSAAFGLGKCKVEDNGSNEGDGGIESKCAGKG